MQLLLTAATKPRVLGTRRGGQRGQRKRRGRVSQRTRAQQASQKDIIRPCAVVGQQFRVPMKTVSIPVKQYTTTDFPGLPNSW